MHVRFTENLARWYGKKGDRFKRVFQFFSLEKVLRGVSSYYKNSKQYLNFLNSQGKHENNNAKSDDFYAKPRPVNDVRIRI